MLSCGRVKTELSGDVTVSIDFISEHALGSLGIMRGHFACLSSFIEVRTSNFECSSVFVNRASCFEHLILMMKHGELLRNVNNINMDRSNINLMLVIFF